MGVFRLWLIFHLRLFLNMRLLMLGLWFALNL